jgi:signal transduction histidine kinase
LSGVFLGQVQMSDPHFLYQLSRKIFAAIGASLQPEHILRSVGEFWAADICWLRQGQEQLVYDRSGQLTNYLPQDPHEPPFLANHQVMWATTAEGYLALAKKEAWAEADRAALPGIAELVVIAIRQLGIQRQVETAKESVRHVQALVDERTSQYQSSQSLLTKLREADRRRIQQLDLANRLKDEFISTISHELRTPLTSMSLAIRMLRKPGIDPERQAKYLEILEQQCAQEIALINDLLTLQKLESNQIPHELKPVQLQHLVEPLIDRFQSTWASKKLQLLVTLPAPFEWQTEPEKVSRILQELLANAGKYSQPQTVVELRGRIEAGNLIVRAIDRGKSISKEEQFYIFDKFRRGEGVTQQAIGGTGLGLALVKSLVQHLQGEISVTSHGEDPLAEVCFEVSLPILTGESAGV